MKRRHSSESSASSFVTAGSQPEHQTDHAPSSLKRKVSPPPTNRKKIAIQNQKSATAAVEAGEVNVEDHFEFFSRKLSAARLPEVSGRPQLAHAGWLELYNRNLHDAGHHFLIHQHDHPVAGHHHDLRLQCNSTSSISFAIMYGLPGDPNSRRLNRNATETRVHNIWNHLIETASHETGTMLIWDTGEYEVLPYEQSSRSTAASDSDSDSNSDSDSRRANSTRFSLMSEPAKLAQSFSRRKIRLRLHGTRLPPGYTIGVRLTLDNDRSAQPKSPSFKRKRKPTQTQVPPARKVRRTSTSSSSSAASGATRDETHRNLRRTVSSLKRTASPPTRNHKPNIRTHVDTAELDLSTHTTQNEAALALASEDENEDESEAIRLTNAYLGATNSIGSIHQRKWYLSLDRSLSGFVPIPTPKDVNHHAKTYWVRGQHKDGSKTGFERFHVLGRDVERSAVTGRLASDILRDEGVEGYVPRGKWRGVTE